MGIDRRKWKILGTVGAIACVAIAACLYYSFDPAESRMAPKCLFHAVTGLDCPGCGAQRMIHALLHGDVAGAWRANAFLFFLFPLLGLMTYSSLTRMRHPRLYACLNSLPMIGVISVAIVGWFLIRNFAM